MHTLLLGVVGSQAYGLAHSGSDIDRLGVFAYDTDDILGLYPAQESIVRHNPDVTLQEAKKFVHLCLKMNPTVTELLWLNQYEEMHALGGELIEIRKAFLSRSYVRNAYFGYASAQMRRITRSVANAEHYPRLEKHARHLMRLLIQGYNLYTTGELTVLLDAGQQHTCRTFAEEIGTNAELGSAVLNEYATMFTDARTPLPEKADVQTVNDWLLSVRKAFA